jgi:hypothetical protein
MQPITEAQKLRRERIQRLHMLIGRAEFEAAMSGFRGGREASISRSEAVSSFKRELNLLLRKEEKDGLAPFSEELEP